MTQANQAALAAFKAQLAAQTVAHHVGPQTPEVYDQKPTNYVFAKNGLFRVVTTPIAVFKTKIDDMPAKVISTPGLSAMQEGVDIRIPKISFKWWLKVLSWYKDVHTKDSTEASILFFWNHAEIEIPEKYTNNTEIKGLTEDGQLIVYCPQQKNSGTLSNFTGDGMVSWLRQNTTPLLETHSHHTMGAFWSGTDDANENMTQFYGVYGKIKSEKTEFKFRFVSGDHKIDIDPTTLFDWPTYKTTIKTTTVTTQELVLPEGLDIEFEPPAAEHEEDEDVIELRYEGPWPMVEYPDDWFAQHEKSSYVNTGYPKGPGNYERYGKTGTPSGAAATQGYQRSIYDYDDDYGYDGYGAYGYGGYGGARRADTNDTPTAAEKRAQALAANQTSKKNGTEAGAEESETVEAGNSIVEVFAGKIMDELDSNQVRQLLEELCDYGYDYVIRDIYKDVQGYGYGGWSRDY